MHLFLLLFYFSVLLSFKRDYSPTERIGSTSHKDHQDRFYRVKMASLTISFKSPVSSELKERLLISEQHTARRICGLWNWYRTCAQFCVYLFEVTHKNYHLSPLNSFRRYNPPLFLLWWYGWAALYPPETERSFCP